MWKTQLFVRIISLKCSQASGSLLRAIGTVYNPLHDRERRRERSAIGNRLIGIIRQYWQFVTPIFQFPFATRRAKFRVNFFRWHRVATFRQSYRTYIRAFCFAVNLFPQQLFPTNCFFATRYKTFLDISSFLLIPVYRCVFSLEYLIQCSTFLNVIGTLLNLHKFVKCLHH